MNFLRTTEAFKGRVLINLEQVVKIEEFAGCKTKFHLTNGDEIVSGKNFDDLVFELHLNKTLLTEKEE